jgi:hypothetical protein
MTLNLSRSDIWPAAPDAPVTGTAGGSVATAVSVGISVAVLGSLATAVMGSCVGATFVLVGPPPQAASTIAVSTINDNSMVVFLILDLLLSKPVRKLEVISKKYATLK